LWASDVSPWPSDQRSRRDLAANPAWLELKCCIPQRDAIQDVIFIAVDDSNLAMEAAAQACSAIRGRRFPARQHRSRCRSRHRQTTRLRAPTLRLRQQIRQDIETHALLLYFLAGLKSEGTTDPGRSFVAVTDAGSYLAEHARTYGFRAALLDPPGIKGRYSSLLHFRLLLSALWRFDPAARALRAMAVRDLRQPHTPPDRIPRLLSPRSWQWGLETVITTCIVSFSA